MLQHVRALYRERELLANLTLRELRGKYRRSFLGWAWSMINPLATIAVFTFVFKVLLTASPPLGDPSGVDSFALYLLSGLIPWNFYSLVTGMGLGAMLGNPTLVRKVHFRREILVFSQVTFAFVQFMIEMAIVIVVISIFGGPWVLWRIPEAVILMLVLALFGCGIALVLSVAAVYFRDLNYLWTIVLQLSFYATPVVYSDELLKENISQPWLTILQWNPLAIFIRSFRHLLYDGRSIPLATTVQAVVWAALSLATGLVVFSRLQRRLAEEV